MLPLLVAALVAVACLWPWLSNRWKYRHIPGPFALPLVGNLPGIIRLGMHEFMMQCKLKHGKTFKVYAGNAMLVVTADPEVSRKLSYRMINRAIGGQLRIGDQDDQIANQGLVLAKDEQWRTLRLSWQPAFQSGSLEGYSELMDSSALQLAQHLKKLGESGQPVEMWRELGRMTLHVVGSTAFGVDFHTLEQDASSPAAAEGMDLIQACQTVFAASSLTRGSIYFLLNAVVPLPGLIGWMARTMPDSRLKTLLHARRTIRKVSSDLIATWRSSHPVSINANATAGNSMAPAGPKANTTAAAVVETPLVETISATVPTEDATSAAPPARAVSSADVSSKDQANKAAAAAADDDDAAAAAKKSGGVRRGGGLGIEPGSFMGLMLSARDKASGNSLSDTAVIAQANTFTLAGYETTANTLSFCVFNIASHPEVQERLLAEIDAYGRDRRVAYSDLAKFPYAEAIVREALRLYPPATMVSRLVKEGGFDITPKVRIPAGKAVFCFMYGYQRDPDYWPEALEFKPERWLPEGAHLAAKTPDAWTPFGAGARMCVGWRFALQEAKIALVRLYQNQTYQLEPNQIPLQLQQTITLAPKNGVWVRVVPRA